MKRIIYALKCPFTGRMHYIGKSTTGILRPMQHVKRSHSQKIRDWVEDLRSLGHKPEIAILEMVSDDDDINLAEKEAITKAIKDGEVLLNTVLTALPTIEELRIVGSNIVCNKETFGGIIKNRRKQAGLTQLELAEKSGVSIKLIRDLEQGVEKGFNTKTLNHLLYMFGLELGVKLHSDLTPTKLCTNPEKHT